VKLRYTHLALADLQNILDYIATSSPQSAQRVQRRLRQITDLLLSFPEAGIRMADPAIRRQTAHPYPFFIFYEITADDIVIHAIRHSARDPSRMPGGE
jgi:plasmid stabilization system protein ParE